MAVRAYKDKPRPFKLLGTGVRCIDTLNPITEGGTGFIPGPFGTGKTVLQHAISKQAEADVVIIAACGERANEVVEIFTEFPELDDPRTGQIGRASCRERVEVSVVAGAVKKKKKRS